jgi:hypothetical protein
MMQSGGNEEPDGNEEQVLMGYTDGFTRLVFLGQGSDQGDTTVDVAAEDIGFAAI